MFEHVATYGDGYIIKDHNSKTQFECRGKVKAGYLIEAETGNFVGNEYFDAPNDVKIMIVTVVERKEGLGLTVPSLTETAVAKLTDYEVKIVKGDKE